MTIDGPLKLNNDCKTEKNVKKNDDEPYMGLFWGYFMQFWGTYWQLQRR